MNRTRPTEPSITFVIRATFRILEIRKALKHLAIETNKPMKTLFLEALEDLLAKYQPNESSDHA